MPKWMSILSGVLAVVAIIISAIALVTVRTTSHDTNAALAEGKNKVTQVTMDRDTQVAFYRGLLLAALSTRNNVAPPPNVNGVTYFDSPIYGPVKSALLAGHPTEDVNLVFSQDGENVFMSISLGDGYAINMVYPKSKGDWKCVAHSNPMGYSTTAQEFLDYCAKPVGGSR